jgi:acylphosphatase
MTGRSAVARIVARVEGRVQGVGFRFFVRDRARALGLSGNVRNLPGGSVHVEAEGSRESLGTLIQELHQGPPAARVERVGVEWHEPHGAGGFLIEAG